MAGTSCCPPSEDLLRFLVGQLSEEEADDLERHIDGCRRCLASLNGLQPRDILMDAVLALRRCPETSLVEPDEALVVGLYRLRVDAPQQRRGDDRDESFDRTTIPHPPGSASSWTGTEEWSNVLSPPEGPEELGRLGPFVILRVLGRGGMGVVFAARQQRPRRHVALKMILGGPRGERQRLNRFRAEAEIIAGLQHPNIVPIHEFGEHEGRPYFTMELLDGGSLAQKLADTTLAPVAAARLVEVIARAVHFAHERGIVHRDLKPANVLLTAAGVPKVGDFGLAKQLADDSGDSTVSGAVLGTPSYMAPEQAGGQSKDLGPPCDVYALGAILYECLTGRPPFRAATPLETLDQVRTRDPLSPGRLQPGLPRDLQTICLKCLEKGPARRYASALNLADDLGRFLRGEPIRARPVALPERLLKWTRRRPALAALVAVCILSLASFLTGVLIHESQLSASEAEARRQRELAANNYRSARDTLNRIQSRLYGRQLGDVPQLKELQQELLEDTLTFYQGVLEHAGDPDPQIRLDTAAASYQAGVIHRILGRMEAAAENFSQALTLVDGLPSMVRDTPDAQEIRIGSFNALGLLAHDVRRWDEAERHHQAAVTVSEQLVLSQPDNPAWRNRQAESEHNLAIVYQLTNRPGEAETHYGRAVTIRTQLVDKHPEENRFRFDLAEDLVNLALIYQHTQRLDKAAQTYENAESLLRPLVNRFPPGGDYALSLAILQVNRSYLLRAEYKDQPALDNLCEAVDLAEAVLKKEPRHQIARARTYSAHGARAKLYEAMGRYADAVPDWDRVVELDQAPDAWARRVERAVTLARAGDHVRAAAEAQALADNPAVIPEGLYDLACAFALAIKPARADSVLSPSEQEALAERYATRATALLQKLHTKGYFKDAGHAEALRTDADLDPLRSRPDFPKVLRNETKDDPR